MIGLCHSIPRCILHGATARMAELAATKPFGRIRGDDAFFVFMAGIGVIAVIVGFGPSYFSAGMVFAPLPSLLVHVHALVFLTWLAVFIAQISLVATHRVQLHMRLGLFGISLAAFMVPLGVLTASARVARQLAHPGPDSLADILDLYVAPLFEILVFVIFVILGAANRSRPAVHKRLMLFAMLTLLEAPLDRWHIFDPYPLWQVNLMSFVPLVLVVMAYDRLSTGRIQRVTIWSTVFLLSTQQLGHIVGQTELWANFSRWSGAQVPPFLL